MTNVTLFLKVFIVITIYAVLHISWKFVIEGFHIDLNINWFGIQPLQNLNSIDNRLIKRQKTFSLPPDGQKIFKRIGFEILPGNSREVLEDRIYNQMRYVPPNYSENDTNVKEKIILISEVTDYIFFGDFKLCPVSKCKITSDRKNFETADIILWIRTFGQIVHKRPPNQIWAILFLESPMHTPNVEFLEVSAKSMINWTITYRPDSTITHPYRKYSPYDLINPPPERYPLPRKNYAKGKKKMAAWFASNCNAANDRNRIVKMLQEYIPVDTYGSCGRLTCPRSVEKSCFKLLDTDYKFYLAFENSYCRHYITEKFFLNGLSHNVIPIVLGAHPDDYKRVAPPHSYIHIDDFKTIGDLANYMKYLDKNDTAYNEYFAWKSFGTVDFNHFFYCRLCAMAHESDRVKTHVRSLHKWWHGPKGDICFRSGSWKKHK